MSSLSFLSGHDPEERIFHRPGTGRRVLAKGEANLSFGLVFGLGLAIWSANAGVKAMIDALNVVYDAVEKRGFIKLNVVSFTFTAVHWRWRCSPSRS